MHRSLARIATTVIGVVALLSCTRTGQSNPPPSYPGAVPVNVSQMRFDDGDSFFIGEEVIRLLGVDTPETRSPSVGIFEDQPHGVEAAESTEVWVLRARRVEILRDGRGHYGRRLAHLFLDGELLSVRLLGAGLAYENVSHFGDNGYPDLADRILDAAANGPKPDFEPPYRWRQKHQKK